MDSDDPKKIYYSISEVSELTGVKPHILRFWEKDFSVLRPRKNRAGNRAYRERDIRVVRAIKKLLYEEGYTIKGARDRLRNDRSLVDEGEVKTGPAGGPVSPGGALEMAQPAPSQGRPDGLSLSGVEKPFRGLGLDPEQVQGILTDLRKGLTDLLRLVDGAG